VTKRRRRERRSDVSERKRRAVAQIELGDLLKGRREGDKGISQQDVANFVGCTQGFYAELEAGTRSSGEVRLWLAIADALDLAPKRILRLVWEARGSLPLTLPDKSDSRLDTLLEMAIEMSSKAQGGADSE
jgi:transcriptional regulator with XRE-family HTH domain